MRENGNHRGTSILMRRTSVSRNRQSPPPPQVGAAIATHLPTGTTTSIQNPKDDPFEGMWMYPEFMDIIAVVAVLCLGVATSSIFAFTMEEIQPANERYLVYRKESIWSKQPYPVSMGLSIYGFMSTTLSSLSLVLSVGVRMMLSYAANMESHSRQRVFLLKWANPMSVIVIIIWHIALGCAAVTVYFVGWVAFPEEVAHGAVQLGCGVTFIVAIFTLFCLTIYIVKRSLYLAKKDRADAQKVVETPAPRPRNQAPMGRIIVEQEESAPMGHMVVEQEEAPPAHAPNNRSIPPPAALSKQKDSHLSI